MDQAVEKCSGGDDDGLGGDGAAIAELDAENRAAGTEYRVFFRSRRGSGLGTGDDEIRHFCLLDLEIGLRLQDLAHLEAVGLLVALGAGRPDGWPTRGVEETELDANRVGDLPHDAAESINLADEMSFGDPSNGRIAGHLGDQVEVEGVEGGLQAQARRGHGGLASGVAGAHYHDVELFSELHRRKGEPKVNFFGRFLCHSSNLWRGVIPITAGNAIRPVLSGPTCLENYEYY